MQQSTRSLTLAEKIVQNKYTSVRKEQQEQQSTAKKKAPPSRQGLTSASRFDEKGSAYDPAGQRNVISAAASKATLPAQPTRQSR